MHNVKCILYTVQETKAYYCRRSAQWLSTLDVPAYIDLLDSVLREEEGRCASYLNAATRPRLLRVLLEECVVQHRDQIFEAVKDLFYALYDNTQVLYIELVQHWLRCVFQWNRKCVLRGTECFWFSRTSERSSICKA